MVYYAGKRYDTRIDAELENSICPGNGTDAGLENSICSVEYP